MITPIIPNRMRRGANLKLRCISFQPSLNAPQGWGTYDKADVSRRLDLMVAAGFNCVKRNGAGLRATSGVDYPPDSQFRKLLDDWYRQLRQRNVKTLLNASQPAVFGSSGGIAAASAARMAQVLQWHIESGAEVSAVGYDPCNEINLVQPTSWSSASQMLRDLRTVMSALKSVAPWLPMGYSVNITSTATSIITTEPSFKMVKDAGCDFHSLHPYNGHGSANDITVSQAPSLAWFKAFEQSSYFLGSYFIGECGIHRQNTDAAKIAWEAALGEIARRPACMGANAFSDQDFGTGLTATYGVLTPRDPVRLGQMQNWPSNPL